MPIDVSCPSCFRHYRVREETAGRQFRCRDCDAIVTVPSAGGGQGDGGELELSADPVFSEPDRRSAPSPPRRRPVSQDPYRGAELALLPGVALMITGSLTLLVFLGNAAIIPIMILNDPNANAPPEGIAALVVMAVVQVVIGGIVSGLIFAGGNSLRKCGSYGLAMTGAIVAIVSFIFGCFCAPAFLSGVGTACLNLPVGIWAVVILSNQDVKAAFSKAVLE